MKSNVREDLALPRHEEQECSGAGELDDVSHRRLTGRMPDLRLATAVNQCTHKLTLSPFWATNQRRLRQTRGRINIQEVLTSDEASGSPRPTSSPCSHNQTFRSSSSPDAPASSGLRLGLVCD
jgi:hypothetical protein